MKINDFLSELEIEAEKYENSDMYLWSNTPIQGDLQHEIIQVCGASDHDIFNHKSRTYKILKEIKRILTKWGAL